MNERRADGDDFGDIAALALLAVLEHLFQRGGDDGFRVDAVVHPQHPFDGVNIPSGYWQGILTRPLRPARSYAGQSSSPLVYNRYIVSVGCRFGPTGIVRHTPLADFIFAFPGRRKNAIRSSRKDKDTMSFADLFRPKWKHSNDDDRKAAVMKLTKQSLIALIAKDDDSWSVRIAAVNRLTDPIVLAEIAKNANDSFEREAAVCRITDKTLLAQIAKNDKSGIVRTAAVENPMLTDQAVLADVAKNEMKSGMNFYTVQKLSNQAALANVAKNDESSEVRMAAVKKLTDQAILIEIAENDEEWKVRMVAVENPNFTNQAILAQIAKNDRHFQVRSYAVRNPNFSDQSILTQIAMAENEGDVGLTSIAVRKLTDEAALAEIVKNAKSDYVRENAEIRLQELRTR